MSNQSGNSVLVAYFSCSGNTERVAGLIAEQTGATLYKITPETPYTSADLEYQNSSSRSSREQNDASARPAITGRVQDLAKYDTVFIGYPTWWGQAPKVILTFLESHDLGGKTIVPFTTSHSSPLGSRDTNLHRFAPAANWNPGIRISGQASREAVNEWIKNLRLTANRARGTSMFDLNTRTVLLNSGHAMPIVGLGTYSLLDGVCARSVSEHLKAGGRLIDTAFIYHNEASVGQGVRESGVPREEVFVTTKLYPSQYDNADAAIDEALQKLDLGYIDLLLLHHPGEHDVAAYKAMERAVRDGKVRSIGLSCYYVAELDKFLPQVSITPALVQNEIHPYYQDNDVTPYIQSKGIVVQGWYPLGGRGYNKELLNDSTLAGIARAHGKSLVQVILRWNLQKSVAVIPGSSNPTHIRENLGIFDFTLSEKDMAAINALDRNEKHDWY